MMKAMGYFEVYYMQTLEDKKFNLARFKDDDYNSNDIKNISPAYNSILVRLKDGIL